MPEEIPQSQILPSGGKRNNLSSILEAGIFEIIFISIFLILVLSVLNYFNVFSLSSISGALFGWLPHQKTQIKNQTMGSIPSSSPAAEPQKNTTNFSSDIYLQLPLSQNVQGVKLRYVTYNFLGFIQEVKKTQTGIELTLDIPEKNIPTFILNKHTLIWKMDHSGSKALQLSELERSQKVNIEAQYFHETHTWSTKSLIVFDASLLTPTGTINR